MQNLIEAIVSSLKICFLYVIKYETSFVYKINLVQHGFKQVALTHVLCGSRAVWLTRLRHTQIV